MEGGHPFSAIINYLGDHVIFQLADLFLDLSRNYHAARALCLGHLGNLP